MKRAKRDIHTYLLTYLNTDQPSHRINIYDDLKPLVIKQFNSTGSVLLVCGWSRNFPMSRREKAVSY